MPRTRMFWLMGPLAVRDLVAGSSGVVGTIMAFVAGCAFASAGNLAWFGFFGLVSVMSLHSSLAEFRRVSHIVRGHERDNDDRNTLPLAA